MNKISRRSFLQAAGVLAAAGLAGCGAAGSSSFSSSASGSAASSGASAADSTPHEPITILTAQRDYTAFVELLHTYYPEINVQFEPYRGQNVSGYMKKQLETGCLPDIYTTTYAWDAQQQAEHLIDLSKYGVTDLYAPAQMAQVDVGGASYLLPYDFTILSIGYNKSLFERQGWAVPTSFAEMQQLVPVIQAAGFTPAVCQLNLPGFGFQLFCNVSDTIFLNTLEGRRWQEDFLSGKASAADGLQESAELFQQWIDAGVINMNNPDYTSVDTNTAFRQGNVAFHVGTLGRYTQNEDGTGDQYDVLPYLSPDGVTNTYVLQVLRCYGLNKQLEEPGNEQKLEDALHFLEVLSTQEGFAAIQGASVNTNSAMCAVSDFVLPKTHPYYSALNDINNGHLAPFIYSGWEEHTVEFGNAVRSWAAGKMTGAQALAVMDATQQQVLAAGTTTYAEVTEVLDTRQTAQIIGQVYISKTGADAALISYNVWKDGVPMKNENMEGVNGKLLPGGLTEQDIVSVLPTGWYNTIPTVTLTGARVQEIFAAGYDRNGDGNAYPYVLVTRNNAALDAGTTYTVAFAGLAMTIAERIDQRDSGIVGLDAAKAYFEQVGEVSSKTLWQHS